MNPKHEKFIDRFIATGNASQAYVEAGYSPKGADAGSSRLLSVVSITQEVEARRIAIRERTVLNVNTLIDHLETIRNRCMQGEPVLDNEGQPTGEWKFDSKGALRAIEMIGKHLGMWEGRQQDPDRPIRAVSPTPFNPQQTLAMIIELRRNKNAIQIESPREIPVQPTPTDSQAMGGGGSELPDFAGLQEPINSGNS